jgi:hypothetical protein
MPRHLRGFIVSLLLGGLLAASVRFSAAAQPAEGQGYIRGPYLQISTENYDKYSPAVAYDSIHDDYLVVWETGEAKHQIRGEWVTSSGLLLKSFLISNATYPGGTFDRFNPAVVFDSIADRYLVVWAYDTQGDGTDWDIYGRYLPWNGPVGSQQGIAIADSTKNEQHPAVAACARANQFLVVYQQTRNGGTDDDIFGSFLVGNGTLTGPFFVGGTIAQQGAPHVSCNYDGGEYFVAWHDMYANPQYRFGIWGKWLKPDNTSNGDFEIVAPSDLRDRLNPAVASGRSTTLVVWEHFRETNPAYRDIWGSILTHYAVFLPFIIM